MSHPESDPRLLADLHRACTRLLRLATGGVAASFFRYNPEGETLTLTVNSSLAEDRAPTITISASEGIAGMVFLTQSAVLVSDVAESPSFARPVAEGTGYVPQRILCAPVTSDRGPLGVVQVLDPDASLPEADQIELALEAAHLLAMLPMPSPSVPDGLEAGVEAGLQSLRGALGRLPATSQARLVDSWLALLDA